MDLARFQGLSVQLVLLDQWIVCDQKFRSSLPFGGSLCLTLQKIILGFVWRHSWPNYIFSRSWMIWVKTFAPVITKLFTSCNRCRIDSLTPTILMDYLLPWFLNLVSDSHSIRGLFWMNSIIFQFIGLFAHFSSGIVQPFKFILCSAQSIWSIRLTYLFWRVSPNLINYYHVALLLSSLTLNLFPTFNYYFSFLIL